MRRFESKQGKNNEKEKVEKEQNERASICRKQRALGETKMNMAVYMAVSVARCWVGAVMQFVM